MKPELIKKFIIWGLVALTAIILFSSIVGFSNDQIDLRNRFEQKMEERTAFYDKLWKIINQKGQVASRVDSSFYRNVKVIMDNRGKKGEGLMMEWVKETNPNANFGEVSKIYQDLSRAIEGQREGFFDQEKMLQDIKREHSNLIQKFPNSFFNIFFGYQPLVYKAITSDRTDDVIRTGKDNNTDVF